jgi:hypothetical protein
MLAGRNVAQASSHAIGCTFENNGYAFDIGNYPVLAYDTTGLNESLFGRVPTLKAIAGLFKLIRDLATNGGLDFLIFVTRPRITENTCRNYELFHKVFAREKVPILIAITCLENEQDMDAWWDNNKKEFESSKMEFSRHACITATRGRKLSPNVYSLDQEYTLSTKKLRAQVSFQCAESTPWKEDADAWFRLTLTHLLNGFTTFINPSRANLQNLIVEALVKYARLSRSKAKRIAVKIAKSLELGG